MRKQIANLPEVEAALKSLNSANVHRSVQDMMMNKFIAAFEAIDNLNTKQAAGGSSEDKK